MFFNIIDKKKFDILMTFSWNAQSFLYYPAIQLILLSKKEWLTTSCGNISDINSIKLVD